VRVKLFRLLAGPRFLAADGSSPHEAGFAVAPAIATA
jgi:hypothetical protein